MKKMIFLIIMGLAMNMSYAENRMKKATLHDTKQKLQDESLGANISYYKTYGKEVGNHYKMKGQELRSTQSASAGSYHIQSDGKTPIVIVQENYGNINNIAIQDGVANNGK